MSYLKLPIKKKSSIVINLFCFRSSVPSDEPMEEDCEDDK